MMDLKDKTVSVVIDREVKGYPVKPPFDPPNEIYAMVSKLFAQIGDPIQSIVKPGDIVVIKPNMVNHCHPKGEEYVLSTVTHGSVIRPVIDIVYKALKGKGKIYICDTSLEKADFDEILRITGIGNMVEHLRTERNYPLEVFDLRPYKSVHLFGDKWKKKDLAGDPAGYLTVDLKSQSEFAPLDNDTQNYHTLADHTVDHYEPFCKESGIPNNYHNADRHKYVVARTLLNADVVISMPKLKTHCKAGVTINLKNMIGIISGKKYIPHHRPGNPPQGDAFAKAPPEDFVKYRFIRQKIARSLGWLEYIIGKNLMKKTANAGRAMILEKLWPVKAVQDNVIQWGDWYGNDTLWRAILDVNKILLYCDRDGVLSDRPQRKYFSVIDGIVGHEGNGPMAGDPINSAVLIGGFSPASVDVAGSMIMGFSPEKIKSLSNIKNIRKYFLGESEIKENDFVCNTEGRPDYKFKPPKGWKGHIEK